jgi:hypothetical protein
VRVWERGEGRPEPSIRRPSPSPSGRKPVRSSVIFPPRPSRAGAGRKPACLWACITYYLILNFAPVPHLRVKIVEGLPWDCMIGTT